MGICQSDNNRATEHYFKCSILRTWRFCFFNFWQCLIFFATTEMEARCIKIQTVSSLMLGDLFYGTVKPFLRIKKNKNTLYVLIQHAQKKKKQKNSN